MIIRIQRCVLPQILQVNSKVLTLKQNEEKNCDKDVIFKLDVFGDIDLFSINQIFLRKAHTIFVKIPGS